MKQKRLLERVYIFESFIRRYHNDYKHIGDVLKAKGLNCGIIFTLFVTRTGAPSQICVLVRIICVLLESNLYYYFRIFFL